MVMFRLDSGRVPHDGDTSGRIRGLSGRRQVKWREQDETCWRLCDVEVEGKERLEEDGYSLSGGQKYRPG